MQWLEASGLRVVPLVYTRPWSQLSLLLPSLSAVLIPGGTVTYWQDSSTLSPFAQTVCAVYDYITAVNDDEEVDGYYPLWGTGTGMNMIHLCAWQRTSTVQKFAGSPGKRTQLTVDRPKDSRLFDTMVGDRILTLLSTSKVVFLDYTDGVSSNRYKSTKRITKMFVSFATTVDFNGETVVAVMEARKYPYYGTLFHPEKAAYEWGSGAVHTKEGVDVGKYLGGFFGNEARRNWNEFGSEEALQPLLIFNWQPIYTGKPYTKVYPFR